MTSPGPSAPCQAWTDFARSLAAFSITYNVAEGLVSMAFGWSGDSVALFGFGADSFIEVGSAFLVLWRLLDDGTGCRDTRIRRERLAARGIAVLFVLLSLGTAAGAILQWAERKHPETTAPGLIISLLSLSFMYWLWGSKVRAAKAMDSRTLEGDARCSLACMKLSAVLFLGSLVYWLIPTLWWVDAAAALVLSAFIGKEGWDLARSAGRPNFTGGCRCG